MERIKYYIDKNKVVIILISVLIIAIAIFFVYLNNEKNNKEIANINNVEEKTEEQEDEEEKNKVIKVDIKGQVKTPGVYQMEEDSRIIDVVNKAGGLLKTANTDYINLSKKVVDEMVIIIYSNKEIEKYEKQDKEIIYIEYECKCPDNKNDACINKDDVVNTNGVKEESDTPLSIDDNKDSLISINTDNVEELMKLSGIGESKAKSIINYRKENGNFENLEDIMKVSGIGESAYNKIKENIKL